MSKLIYANPEQYNAPKQKWLWFATITVPAHISFPVDMLRYDRCTPATEDDSHSIGLTQYGSYGEEKVIQVERTSDAKVWPFTNARWESRMVRIEPTTVD